VDDDGLWLGGNDIQTAGTFIWESSGLQVTYTNWDVDRPDDHEQFENCLHMWKGKGFWNDINCDNILQSTMCEII